MAKKIIISESQLRDYISYLAEERYPINTDKVLLVKKYLDENFRKGAIDTLGEDGMPNRVCVISMVSPLNGATIKNFLFDDILDLLVEKFKNMFDNKDQRRKFLGQVMRDWYDNKIGLYGSLSVNHV